MLKLLATTLATAVWAATFSITASPADAATRPMPGRFTGYAFDACRAPSQAVMDAWLESSPYWGIGIYIAGDNRYCGDGQQTNLTSSWVATQARKGWRLLPLTVGRQASCFKPGTKGISRISPDPASNYAKARMQGRAEAVSTVAASRALGLPTGTTQWLDIEAFDLSNTHCRRSMLAFTSGWTQKLHKRGYRSGLYSNASSGIAAVEGARTLSPGSYALPDQLWFAHWNGRANTKTSYLADSAWKRQRIHQYLGDHDESHGGVRINIDSNWMDVGGGSRAPRQAPSCGVRVNFPTYHKLRRGERGAQVAALQCLLRQQDYYTGRTHGRFDRRTLRAVKRFQRAHPTLAVTGVATKPTWVAVHAAGKDRLVKVGAASNVVRRVQRALNAATAARLPITGVFDKRTAKAVKRYQRSQGLPRTGVVGSTTWPQLQQGRR